MAIISGNVIFDRNRSATNDAGDTPIQNVNVVLQNTASNARATATTDASGFFQFTNVPSGTYRLVESYGLPLGASSVDFVLTSAIGPIPVGIDPPISAVVNPQPQANNIDSINPNTINLTVGTTDITDILFLDGPVTYTPITTLLDPCATIGATNIITAADNGTMGTFPAGTLAMTGAPGTAAAPPYPGVTPGFIYTQPNPAIYDPQDGYYTIQNIANNTRNSREGEWWRIADHTTGDETGRFMLVNGSTPGAVFFTQTVSVTPNTNYVFSSWILNIIKIAGLANPALGVTIRNMSGSILYQQDLGNSIPTQTIVPEWKEIGAVFNSGADTSLIVEFTSEGPAAIGNDYAIDDISLQEIIIPEFKPVKSASPLFLAVGETTTYTVTLNNTCSTALTNVSFVDSVPAHLEFVPGTVTINTTPYPAYDPNVGFIVPNIPGGGSATITFDAKAISIPNPSIVENTATMSYNYTPIIGAAPMRYTFDSNMAQVTINTADLASPGNFTKTADKAFADIGDVITYTLTATNTGNVPANNVVFTDIPPNGTVFVAGSVASLQPFTGTSILTGITLVNPILPGETVTLTYKVDVTSMPNPNPIENTANVDYAYTVDPANPDGKTATATTPVAITQVNHADLLSPGNFVKTVDKAFADVGDIVTYTITVKNTGNVAASDVVVTDVIPAGTTYVAGSVTSSALFTGDPTTAIKITAPINPNDVVTISFKVKVVKVPTTNPIPNQAKIDYTYKVDPNSSLTKPVSGLSNIVDTQVNNATLKTVKAVDKTLSYVGDTITYNIAVTNTGNVNANNVVITDNIPFGTSLVPGSLTVSAPYTGDPTTAITLTNPIAPGQTVSVLFKVLVNEVPNPNPIDNKAVVDYSYIVDPNNPDGKTATSTSNVVSTKVLRYNFSQEVTDIINSIALQQAALANIADAEGKKIQAAVANPNITTEQLMCINKSVQDMMNSISLLESMLKQKLNAINCQINSNSCM